MAPQSNICIILEINQYHNLMIGRITILSEFSCYILYRTEFSYSYQVLYSVYILNYIRTIFLFMDVQQILYQSLHLVEGKGENEAKSIPESH